MRSRLLRKVISVAQCFSVGARKMHGAAIVENSYPGKIQRCVDVFEFFHRVRQFSILKAFILVEILYLKFVN